MGITTKVAKRIWQHRSIVRPMHDQHKVVVSSTEEPDYLLIVDATTWLTGEDDEVPVIITVMFSCREDYVREGETYRVLADA